MRAPTMHADERAKEAATANYRALAGVLLAVLGLPALIVLFVSPNSILVYCVVLSLTALLMAAVVLKGLWGASITKGGWGPVEIIFALLFGPLIVCIVLGTFAFRRLKSFLALHEIHFQSFVRRREVLRVAVQPDADLSGLGSAQSFCYHLGQNGFGFVGCYAVESSSDRHIVGLVNEPECIYAALYCRPGKCYLDFFAKLGGGQYISLCDGAYCLPGRENGECMISRDSGVSTYLQTFGELSGRGERVPVSAASFHEDLVAFHGGLHKTH